ncbi:MAG: hypothetical protein ACE37M_11620 [Henriciella sp.]
MHKGLVISVFFFAITGCVNLSPEAKLMGRDTGDFGSGTIENVVFGNSGKIEIQLRNEIYTGQWITVRNEGSTQLQLMSAFYPSGAIGLAGGSNTKRSDFGFGSALLGSKIGNTLHCEYQYSLVTITAIGICEHSDGEIFDLQVG